MVTETAIEGHLVSSSGNAGCDNVDMADLSNAGDSACGNTEGQMSILIDDV
jgi:hypothetical protein